jgi:ABC-type amino acid transport substrate-binding protein
VKKSAKIKSYKDLKNKTVVVTQGTTNERVIKALSDWPYRSCRYFRKSFLIGCT